MILLAHLLFGAMISSLINNFWVAIPLAFLSHYFLDLFPHVEYNIGNIIKKQWSKKIPVIIKVFLDFFSGIITIFILSNNQPIIYICAIIAILPDALTILNNFLPLNILKLHNELHTKKIHFLRYKKISNFWRILSQLVAIILSIIVLRT